MKLLLIILMCSLTTLTHITKSHANTWTNCGSGIAGAAGRVWSIGFTTNDQGILAGDFNTPAQHIALWNGTDLSGIGNLDAGANAVVRNSQGHMMVGGAFQHVAGVYASKVAAWDGAAWLALGTGVTGGDVICMASGSNNQIFVGGNFTTAGGVSATGVARWDGSSWSNLSSGLDGTVYAMAMDENGNLYVGGDFTNAGGVPANRVARWNGMSWAPLGSGMNEAVYGLCVDDAGQLYAAGNFTMADGLPANRVARWNGTSWTGLGAGLNSWGYGIVGDDAGNVYVGGNFTAAGGIAADKVAKWNGSTWSAMGSSINGDIYCLSIDPQGYLYAGGNFSMADGIEARGIARWTRPLSTSILGTNDAVINSGEIADKEKGTDFGAIYTEDSRTNLFSIINRHSSDITISGVATSGTDAAYFKIVDLPETVAVGSTSNFLVIYTPNSTGTHVAAFSLTIESVNGNYVLNLKGTGLKRQQDIDFIRINPQLPTNQIALEATATSGLPVAFEVVSGPASISDGTNLSFSGTGTVRIVASQAGNARWEAAPDVTNALLVVESLDIGILLVGTNGTILLSDDPGSPMAGTDFNHHSAGVVITNIFTITNYGISTLHIAGWVTNGTGASAFKILGIPAQVPAGGTSMFSVVFAPEEARRHEASLEIINDSPISLYRMNLSGTSWLVTPDNGPSAGGNSLVLSSAGNGLNITNVLVGSVPAQIIEQDSDSISVRAPANSKGMKIIVIQSTGARDAVLLNAYNVNVPGVIYDQQPQWTEVAGMPAARAYLSVAVLDDALYAIGGRSPESTGGSTNVFRFDGASWTEVEGLPRAVRASAAGVIGDTIYSIGGFSPAVGESTNVYAFDGLHWTEVPGLPHARSDHAIAVLDDVLYVAGGIGPPLGSNNSTVYRFNGVTWSITTSLPQGRAGHKAGVLDGLIYSIGGSYSTNVFAFDGVNWSEVAGLPTDRLSPAVATMNNRLYVVGGRSNASFYASTNVYRYNGSTWTESRGLPSGMDSAAAGVLDEVLYVVGGYGFDISTNVYAFTEPPVPGVIPSVGSWTGGYTVTISGRNLGDGYDITNVTLNGQSVAEILSQSTNQVIVRANAASAEHVGLGDVRVFSTSFGESYKINAFRYSGPKLVATPNPSEFGSIMMGSTVTNRLYLSNQGDQQLIITGQSTNGEGASAFQINALPGTLAPYSTSICEIICSPSLPGLTTSVLLIANNSPATNYRVGISGVAYALSSSLGPLSGGNHLSLTGPVLGDGQDIYQVVVGGGAATLITQGVDYVTFAPPAGTDSGVSLDIYIYSTSLGLSVFSNAYMYNPRGRIGEIPEWINVAGLPDPLAYHAVANIGDTLHALGGSRGEFISSLATNMYRFNGVDWERTLLATTRHYVAATEWKNCIYMAGGLDGDWIGTTNVFKYDGTSWSEVPGLPQARYLHALVPSTGGLYVIGGRDDWSGSTMTNMYRHDGTNWTEVPGLPQARYALGACTLNNDLYAVGGAGINFATNVYRYNGSHWDEVKGLPLPRFGLAVAALSNQIYAVGGFGVQQDLESFGRSTNAYRFDGTNWTEFVGLPKPLWNLGLGIQGGTLYAVGGDGTNGYSPDVYRYQPVNNIGVSPTSGSWTGGYVVVISGRNLGSGADVTNVTLNGREVSEIVSQSATQVVVRAGVASSEQVGVGDVRVFSVSYGETVRSNGFRYSGPALVATPDDLGFGYQALGLTTTGQIHLHNRGDQELIIAGSVTNGSGSSAFRVISLPESIEPNATGVCEVAFGPAAVGSATCVLQIDNNSPTSDYSIRLSGGAYTISTNRGPYSGSNTVTLAGIAIGDGGDVYQVWVGDRMAVIVDQGVDYLTFRLPGVEEGGEASTIQIISSSLGISVFSNAYTYNPRGQIGQIPCWVKVAGLPDPLAYHTVATLGDTLYAMSGNTGNRIEDISTNVFSFDGINWSRQPAAFSRRYVAAAEWAGSIYVVGGYEQNASSVVVATNLFKYDGAVWTEMEGLPEARYSHSAVSGGDGVYVLGGRNSSHNQVTNVYRYNGTNWVELPGLPRSTYMPGAGYLNGSLYALGISENLNFTNVYRYDGAGWTEVQGLPRSGNMLAVAAWSNRLYAAGGVGIGKATNVFQFDGTNWTEIVGFPKELRSCGLGTQGGSLYAVGGYGTNGYSTNVYRYSLASNFGVAPISGSWTGGYTVTISGSNLGDGGDITNVRFGGKLAPLILSQSATQIVVIAPSHSYLGWGAVDVYSTSFGKTTKIPGFFVPYSNSLYITGTDGRNFASGATPTIASGTDFGYLLPGETVSHTFTFTNIGIDEITITGVETTGPNPSVFTISPLTSSIPSRKSSSFTIAFQPPDCDTYHAYLVFSNTPPLNIYTVQLRGAGYRISTNRGPFAGGNSMTITNRNLGNGLDITNVTVGGARAVISDQGDGWLTIIAPPAAWTRKTSIQIASASAGLITIDGGYTYNPKGQIGSYMGGSWTEVAGLPEARRRMGATTFNGLIYAIGGLASNSVSCTNVYAFDGVTWTEVPGLPVTNAGLAAVVLNTSLYAVCGANNSNVFRLNGSTWTNDEPFPGKRKNMTACEFGGELYAWGGDGRTDTRFTNVFKFNGMAWNQVDSLPNPRNDMSAANLNGFLYAIGGNGTNVYCFDGYKWTEIISLPKVGYSASVAVLHDSIFWFGGHVTNTYRFNGSIWSPAPQILTTYRSYMASAVLDDAIYAIGGSATAAELDSQTNVYRYTESYVPGVDPASGASAGGYTVTIKGQNLCNGADVTRVVLSGVDAESIISQSATQIVVVAGASAVTGPGDVQVYSTSHGVTTASDSFSYVKSDQTIAFPPIPDTTTTNRVVLAATSASGLPISFQVFSGPAELEAGTNLSFLGAGMVNIVASQAGNAAWNPAPSVTNRFLVAKATAGVSLTGLMHIHDGTPKIANATTIPGGLSVEMTYDNNTIPPSAVGNYVVVATVMDVTYMGGATGTIMIVSVTNALNTWLLDARGLDPFSPELAPDADVDLDGATTWAEFIADTDPTNAQSFFQTHVASNTLVGAISLIIDPTSTGRVYRILRATNIFQTPPVWTLHPPPQTGTGSAVIFTTTNEGYYRISVNLP